MRHYNVFGARCMTSAATTSMKSLCLPLSRTTVPNTPPYGHLLSAVSGRYATSDSLGSQGKASRKQVTIRNDDGRVQWNDLTIGEKAARTTQQTLNLGVILAGVVGTVAVGYFLYTEVFASDSKTRLFNRAVDRVRVDPQVLELLGSRKKLRAFGEPTSNKWSRNRPIASSTRIDQTGVEHLYMHFYVVGSENSGVVYMHMVKGEGHPDWEYRSLALDVPGHPRLYLENADATQEKEKPGFKMLGVQWR